jgi:hypothetical protein
MKRERRKEKKKRKKRRESEYGKWKYRGRGGYREREESRKGAREYNIVAIESTYFNFFVWEKRKISLMTSMIWRLE